MLGMKRYAPALTFTKRGSAAVRTRNGPPRNRHVARRLIRPGVVAEDRILVVVEAAEARVVAPGLLHELELAPDARVDAEEMDAARAAVVGELEQALSGRPGSCGSVRTAGSNSGGPKTRARRSRRCASDMLSDCAAGVRLDVVARVGAADVRAERAGQTRPGRRRTGSRRGRRAADRRRRAPEPAARRSATVRRIATPARSCGRCRPRPCVRTASRFMNCQNPATSCCSFRYTT